MLCKDYLEIRNDIKDGDIILWKGTGILARSIQYFDNAKYNHISVVKWVGKRLLNVDMWYQGIEINPLSRRMIYDYKEFCIIRPKGNSAEEINIAIENILQKLEALRKYDYFLLPRIAFYKKTGINLIKLGRNDRYICSELIQTYTNDLRKTNYKDIELITPQDFLRYLDENNLELLYHE